MGYPINTGESPLYTVLEWLTKNNDDEQNQILDYTYFLNYLDTYKNELTAAMGQQTLDYINSAIREHISDEQEHSQMLSSIYAALSGIQPSKD